MSSEQTEGALGGLSSEPQGFKQPTRVGKYRVDGIIGRGAVGIVYRGHDEQIDRPLAIKTLRQDVLTNVADRENLLQRFAAEARSAGRCLHPNIVTVFDYAEQDGSPYIIMEHVDAGTLENVISSGTMLPIRQVGEIMAQLLFALDHAHSKGVVHRDVKPANILCPSATSIKVTDFGVARFDSLGLTNPNGIGAIGTPNYMSPEQFLGRPVDGRADLFSAGVILFQLLAGAKPFVANDIAELMRKLLNESPPHIATLRPGNFEQLNTVVQRALARNPDDRFQTAGEFIDALNAAIEATASDNSPPLDLTKISSNNSASSGTNGGGGSTTGATNPADLSQTMSAKLMPSTLGAVEAALAKSIGPIARVVVRKASLQSTDPDMLLTSLSDQIPIESEASKFRKEAEQSIRADQGVAAVQLDALISNADIQAASEALVPLVGPVAGVLAKRLAQSAIGHEDYFRRLAESIPDEDQRAVFGQDEETHARSWLMAPSDTAGSQGGGGSGSSGRPTPSPQRRRSLRAVFAADIAGFSGRMSLNETNTVNALSEIRVVGRRELETYDGWLFGMPGDGLFATFESAVNAVQCALEIQADLMQRPHLKETPLRIGIHLGEVIIEDDLPYGETLNIAARLESLADPGGILVSGTVMDAVSARVSATFEDRGVPMLKNIPRRIPTFAVKPPPARSPADQTQAGLSNLDRTTRLDRNAIREILEGHIGSGSPVSGKGGAMPAPAGPAVQSSAPQPPAPVTDPAPDPAASADVLPTPVEEIPAHQAPNAPSTIEPDGSVAPRAEPAQYTPPPASAEPPADAADSRAQPQPSMLDKTLPLPKPPPPTQPKAAPEAPETSVAPSAPTDMPVARPPEAPAPRRPTLSEKLAQLPTPPPAAPTSQGAPTAQPAEPLASAATDTQLEKTLPPATPSPSLLADGSALRPTVAFLEEITKALAVHVGPFSKLIVNREMKSNPSIFELISKLEEHIPNDDERLIFRVRASHINSLLSGSGDDQS